MMRTLPWLLGAMVAMIASPSFAQGKPDFSGVWVAHTATEPQDPLRLIVTQPLTRTTARGEPMPPTFLRLTVEKVFTTGSRTETHFIGTEGGTVGGTVGGLAAGTGERVETRNSVAWDADRLRIWNRRYSGSVETDYTEVWWLDAPGTLHIDIRERTGSGAELTRTLTYERR